MVYKGRWNMKIGRIVAIVLGVAVIGYVGYRFATPKKSGNRYKAKCKDCKSV